MYSLLSKWKLLCRYANRHESTRRRKKERRQKIVVVGCAATPQRICGVVLFQDMIWTCREIFSDGSAVPRTSIVRAEGES